MSNEIPVSDLVLCQCGCGQPAPIAKINFNNEGLKKGEYRKFIRGHHWRVFPRTVKHRMSISKALRGRPKSFKEAERLRKLRIGIPHTEESKSKMQGRTSPMLGKQHSAQAKKKMSEAIKKSGLPWIYNQSYETRQKRSESMRGEKCYNWKGGISKYWEIIYQSFEYRLWRQQVFERDNFICQQCGQLRGKIVAHHIKAKHEYPRLVFVVDNGITLCDSCHRKTHNYGNKERPSLELMNRFNISKQSEVRFLE